jgi:hypothetical protein
VKIIWIDGQIVVASKILMVTRYVYANRTSLRVSFSDSTQFIEVDYASSGLADIAIGRIAAELEAIP